MLGRIPKPRRSTALFLFVTGVSLMGLAPPALAATPRHSHSSPGAKALAAQIKALSLRVEQQAQTIAAQQQAIASLQKQALVEADRPPPPAPEAAPPPASAATMVPGRILPSTDGVRLATAAPPPSQVIAPQVQSPTAIQAAPDHPVGQAPANVHQIQEVAALPESVGVLTPKGHWVVEPSLQLVVSTANRLVFQGVEIIPGIQLGVIDANNADHDTGVATASLRYGITNHLEAEIQLPFVDRQDRVTTLAQRDETINMTENLHGASLGDIDVSARYQINEVEPGQPIFIADAHVKPPTGRGPYDVNYDQFGVATSLATGSGFWGAEGGLTILYPSDPAVIFAGINYTHNFSRDINKTIGGALIGKVAPGDSIGASMGFGLSLNPRLSVSLGYNHIYIFETRSQIGGTLQKANSLQVGSLLMGWSFRLNDRTSLNTNFQFGVTSDAPNMQATVSLPMKF